MDNSTHDMSELLLQYLDGELSPVEKDKLEKQLLVDKSLQEELDNLQLARQTVRMYGLKQKVSTIHKEMMDQLQPVKRIGSRGRTIRIAIAVAASVVVVLFAVQLFNSSSPSADKLFADNYRSYELVTVRGANTEKTPTEKAYRAKNFLLVKQLSDTAVDIESEFLSGMANMELKDYDVAVEKFRSVLSANRTAGTAQFKDESEYYLFLAYLAKHDRGHAVELMNKIHSDPSHTYYEKITDKLMKSVRRL